jgi:hypothetical protein
VPNLVAARCKAWVCGSSLDGTAGSNTAGCMEVCLLCVVRKRSFRRADHSSVGVLPSVACLNVIAKPRYSAGPGLVGTVGQWGT